MDSLTSNEIALVQAYRSCNDVDRDCILSFTKACARENPRGSMLHIAYSAPKNKEAVQRTNAERPITKHTLSGV